MIIRNHDHNTRRGIGLLDFILAMAVLGIASVGSLKLATSHTDAHQAIAARGQEDAFRTLQQNLVSEGLEPEAMGLNPVGSVGVVSFNTQEDDNATVKTAGATTTRATKARISSPDAERVTAVGSQMEASGQSVSPSVNTLLPPSVNTGFTGGGIDPGGLDYDDLPVNDLVVPNTNNPPGTVYRYTNDGTVPNASDPIWDNPELNVTNFPLGSFKVRALNSSVEWDSSPVVTVNFSVATQKILKTPTINPANGSELYPAPNPNRITIIHTGEKEGTTRIKRNGSTVDTTNGTKTYVPRY